MDKYIFNEVEYKYNKEKFDTELTKKEGIKGVCIPLTDLEYNNIKEYMLHKFMLEDGKYTNLKIDCNSYNLKFFILNIFLLFLF